MKSAYVACIVFLLALSTACGSKVNDPADVQALKALLASFDKALAAGDADAGVSNYYAENAIRMDANQPASVGRAAIKESFKSFFALTGWTGQDTAGDVRVSGNLAVVRGSGSGKDAIKTTNTVQPEKIKWVAAYERQADGSWKCIFDAINSDLPAAETATIGENEVALQKLEQDWAVAYSKNDTAAMDKILATDYANNTDGKITPKKQLLANMKSRASKVVSAEAGQMSALVFGDTGVVHGLWTEKSSLNGENTSGTYRYTDTYVKRSGRWQAVSTYSTLLK